MDKTLWVSKDPKGLRVRIGLYAKTVGKQSLIMTDRLEDQLSSLVEAGLLQLNAHASEQEYSFKHALVQEATYHSTLMADRRVLHRRVGVVLECLFADRIGEVCAVVAEHYRRGEEWQKAADYFAMAAARAHRVSAYHEAHLHGTRALACLDRLETNDALSAQRALVLRGLAQAQFALDQYADARATYEASLELSRAQGDLSGMAETLSLMSRTALAQGQLGEAQVWAEEGLRYARQSQKPESIAEALYGLATALYQQGMYAEAATMSEQSLAMRQTQGDHGGVADCLRLLGIIASVQGDNASARTHMEESLRTYREIGNRRGMAASLSNLGIIARRQGMYAEADRLYKEVLSIRREIGDLSGVAGVLNNLAINAMNQKQYAESTAYLLESLTLYRSIGNLPGVALSLASLGEVGAAAGDAVSAYRYFRESLRINTNVSTYLLLTCLVGLASLYMEQGETALALERLGLALSHPALESQDRAHAQSLVERLQAQLPPEVVTAGLERGRQYELTAVVKQELAEASDAG